MLNRTVWFFPNLQESSDGGLPHSRHQQLHQLPWFKSGDRHKQHPEGICVASRHNGACSRNVYAAECNVSKGEGLTERA